MPAPPQAQPQPQPVPQAQPQSPWQAPRPSPAHGLPQLPGLVAAGFLLLAVIVPLAAVLWRAGGAGTPGPADWAALRFTVVQAALSAVISVALAVPLARALARRRFPGRDALVTLRGAPFILPSIVAVLGLLTVFGRAGWLNSGLGMIGLGPVSIYGLHGVVLAHVFFNLPLATRMILQGWQTIPAERFRLAASLSLPPAMVLRTLEWPMLRAILPGALMIIFALCLSSFAVALILGGGPRATTLELAIYQAFRFDFDLGRAAVLGVLQLALVLAAAVLALTLGRGISGLGGGLGRPVRRWDGAGAGRRLGDGLVIVLGAGFVLVPIAAVVLSGLPELGNLTSPVWRAAGVSVVLALVATALCMALTLALALSALSRPALEAAGLVGIALSPLVIGTGLFVLIHPVADPARWALAITALVNALAALPFALRMLLPRLREIEARHGRLADSLGLTGRARLRWLILPLARPVLGFGAGLAAALSMGDLGVIVLFADPDRATLPMQMLRLMGAYRMEQAAAAALLLLALSLALFAGFDRLGRGRAAV